MRILMSGERKVLPTKMNVLRLVDKMLDHEKDMSANGGTRWIRYKAGCRFQGLMRLKKDIRRDLGGKRGRVKKSALIDRIKKTVSWYQTPSITGKATRTENLSRLAVQNVLAMVE